jgi:hypothetical protein
MKQRLLAVVVSGLAFMLLGAESAVAQGGVLVAAEYGAREAAIAETGGH